MDSTEIEVDRAFEANREKKKNSSNVTPESLYKQKIRDN